MPRPTPLPTFSLWRVLRAHPRRTLLVTVLMTLAGVAEGLGLLTLLPVLESVGGGEGGAGGIVVDGLRRLGARAEVPVLIAVILAALVAKALLRWLAMAQVGVVVAGVAAELRTRLLSALFAARWEHFATHTVGSTAAVMSREAFWAANAYRDACAALAAVVQLAVYAAAVMLVSWRLGALALLVGLVVSAPLGLWVRVSRRAGASQTRHAVGLVGRLVDVLQAMKPIRAMGREKSFLDRLAGEVRGLRAAEEEHVRAVEAVRALQEPLLAVVVLGVFLAAVSAGEPLPTVVVLGALFQRMVGRFQTAQSEYQAMVAASSAYAEVEAQIAAAEASLEAPGGNVPAPRAPCTVELDGVRVRNGSRAVLKDISLRIPAGAFVAVVGRSGAGKSTLLDVVAGLRHPDAGRVRVDGVPLRELDRAEWRRHLGYVPQESVLLHDTLFANVQLGDESTGRTEAARALAAAGALDLLSSLYEGLDADVGDRGLRVSGGERRRLALARAVVGRPSLLLLDEATAELDPESAAAIGRTLRSLRGRVTILAVTHHPEMAAAADAVYALVGGRLVPRPAASSIASSASSGSEERVTRQAPDEATALATAPISSRK